MIDHNLALQVGPCIDVLMYKPVWGSTHRVALPCAPLGMRLIFSVVLLHHTHQQVLLTTIFSHTSDTVPCCPVFPPLRSCAALFGGACTSQ